MRCGGVVCCAAAAALSTASDAYAGGAFAIREQSAYGRGAAYAGIAAGGSLSSMFWNPANLSDVRRTEMEAGATAVFRHSDVKLDPQPQLGFPGSNEGHIGQDAVVPAGYAASRLNDRIVVGVGINVPFGLTTEYDGDSISTRPASPANRKFSPST